jgi:hypothetical protein
MDLVRMSVEFYLDEFGKIWLFGVKDLLVR